VQLSRLRIGLEPLVEVDTDAPASTVRKAPPRIHQIRS
jgi:hypothetical protein